MFIHGEDCPFYTPQQNKKECKCEEDHNGNCYFCGRNMLTSPQRKKEIENIIKKNLPEKKEQPQYGLDNYEHFEADQTFGFNQALSQINTSLIADEVLKVIVEKIEHHFYGANDPKIKDIINLLSTLSPNKENK